MNPAAVFIILAMAVLLWVLLSFAFYPLGKFVYRIWKDVVDEINKKDEKETR